ncbi:hypothetical protein ACH5RR_018353 [Cinchona calisaya]|uniref:Uncharacterized protein n=1 Tax=Cinchona calisaya TaxID=153742 RepID=A0ABD2ZM41_9GENT
MTIDSVNPGSHANVVTKILGRPVTSYLSQNNAIAAGPSQKVVPAQTITIRALVYHGVADMDYGLPAAPHAMVNPGKICFQPVVSIKHIRSKWNFVKEFVGN